MTKKRSVPIIHIINHSKLRKTDVVLEASGVWSVVCRGKPITLVTEKEDGKNWRYPKTVFTSPAFAHNLARRLNKLFDTNDFDVKEMT